MFVDDQTELADSNVRLLHKHGLEALPCHRVTQVADMLDNNPQVSFDIMVSDLHMPDGNGYQAIDLLKKHQPDVLAIIVSGNPSWSLISTLQPYQPKIPVLLSLMTLWNKLT